MTEPVVYIGYVVFQHKNERIVKIATSMNPEIFWECFPITAEYGEGSFRNLLFKLEGGLKELKWE
ncbi:MAG: hypothetical protein Q8N99_07195 [Nanoarchaeota archaeon]|nr:hypothetical protein [Nanoarchaeota archaeon]